jgi:hypothetical protein
VSVLGKIKDDETTLLFYCPGCDEAHQIRVSGDGEVWGFNGDFNKPTFTPSYLTWIDANPNAGKEYRKGRYFTGWLCHSFIKDGQIQFLGDCTHELANQTVDLPEWGNQ